MLSYKNGFLTSNWCRHHDFKIAILRIVGIVVGFTLRLKVSPKSTPVFLMLENHKLRMTLTLVGHDTKSHVLFLIRALY